jgi:hypothetical protein
MFTSVDTVPIKFVAFVIFATWLYTYIDSGKLLVLVNTINTKHSRSWSTNAPYMGKYR